MEILKINGDKVPANKCDVKTLEGCNDKEKTYIAAKKELTASAIAAESKRLEGMQGKAMSDDKKSWVSKRIVLLRNLAKGKDEL